MSDDGHRYSFASPNKGWPEFGPDGKIIQTDEDEEDDDRT
jgi:hypothetical protein